MQSEKKCYRLDMSHWTIQRAVYLVGGSFVAISSILALLVNEKWLYFTLFVGVMFINFALTGYCPMAIILDKLGVKRQ